MKSPELSNIVRSARSNRRLTLKQVADFTGKSHQYIHQVETGVHKSPPVDFLIKLSEVLSISSDYLLLISGRLPPDVLYKMQLNPELLRIIREYDPVREVY